MKILKKIVIQLIIISLVAVATIVTYKKINKKEEITINKIAIVNLDDGVDVNGKLVNYGSSLIEMKDNYFVTSIEDARSGVDNDKYAAYIIIPANFSICVESINNTPTRSSIEYSINDRLRQDVKEDIICDIDNFKMVLSNNIEYMYLNAILEEFHSAQDSASVILDNDSTDLEEIINVSNVDLVVDADMPEEKYIDSTIAPLDLSSNYDTGISIFADLKSSYVSDIQKGQESYIAMSNSANQDIGTINNNYQTGLDSLDDYTDSINDNKYISSANTLKNSISSLNNSNNSITENNKNVIINNLSNLTTDSLKENVTEYENMQKEALVQAISKLADDTETAEIIAKPLVVDSEKQKEIYNASYIESYSEAYKLYKEKEVNTKIVDNLSTRFDEICSVCGILPQGETGAYLINKDNMKTLIEVSKTWTPSTPPDGETTTDEPYQDILAEEYNAVANDVISQYKTKTDSSIITMTSDIVDFYNSSKTISNTEDKDITDEDAEDSRVVAEIKLRFKNKYKPNLGKLYTNAIPSQNTKDIIFEGTSNLENVDEDMINEGIYREIITKIQSDLNNNFSICRTELSGITDRTKQFNIYGYIDEDSKENIRKAYEDNENDIKGIVDKKEMEYMEYLGAVWDAANTNVTNMYESISDANDKTKTNIDTAIIGIKTSKEDSNTENMEYLDALVRKLPYTRLGTMEYKQTYDYIVRPIEANKK